MTVEIIVGAIIAAGILMLACWCGSDAYCTPSRREILQHRATQPKRLEMVEVIEPVKLAETVPR